MRTLAMTIAAVLTGFGAEAASPLQLAALRAPPDICLGGSAKAETGMLALLGSMIESRLGYCVELDLRAEDQRALGMLGRTREPDIDDLQISPSADAFVAYFSEPSANALVPAATRAVRGRIHRAVAVLIATRRLATGDTITADDLEPVRVRADRVPQLAAVEQGRLVGMQARWPIQPRNIVLSSQVRAPTVVEKGAQVNVVIKMANLTVTVAGVALEAGATGQVIEIRNPNTNKKLRAQVRDVSTAVIE